ncbi:DgyrCDS2690 [Dimorphilus gyrociliatus]|uniref:DgyrCDS2690 n=1 Tax=Dimorphilus gyrociliatus TaxID=2664684 RepID=A0A7I8VE36_9ANNE|nr:DgyrCDS2690 [Dimorphilus gyrociliatus]
MKVFIFILTFSSLSYLSADLFTANAGLQALSKSEGKLFIGLKEYIKVEQERLKVLRNQIDDMKTKGFAKKFTGDALQFVGHPINAFHVIRHFTKFWDSISKDSAVPANAHILENSWVWANLADESRKPTINDYYGAARAILRLQDIYNIPIDEIVNGSIMGQTVGDLSALDCFELGVSGLQTGKYEQTIRWLKKSLEKAEEDDEDPPKDTRRLIAQAYYHMGMIEEAKKEALIAYNQDSMNLPLYSELGLYRELSSKNKIDNEKYEKFLELNNNTKLNQYRHYCQKGPSVDPKQASKLQCRFKKLKNNPFEVYKIEIKSYDPWIAIIHDIVTDKEAEKIIQLSKPYLKRSKVGGNTNNQFSEIRISQIAWLYDDLDPFINKISDRLTAATGLDAHKSAEPLQVANYGLGGQYELHEDAFGNNTTRPGDLPGDRIYTLMIYLSDVEKGGSTIFPNSKVNLEPIRNAAAVWFNMNKAGSADTRLLHGGCPVIYGTKWVANKWFRSVGQEFTYPCGLTEQEVDNSYYEGIDTDNPNDALDNYYLFDEFQNENELFDSLSFSDLVSQCVLVTLQQIWSDIGPLLGLCFIQKITVRLLIKLLKNVSCSELYMVSPQKWHQVRGSQMILSMKLISLSIDLDNNQIILPKFISFLGYTLHTGSVIFGPWISFQQYTSNISTREKKSDREWVFKLFKSLTLSQIFLAISTCLLQWIIPDDTNKWLLAYRDAQSFRFSHYFVCFFSECTLLTSGIGRDITVVKPLNIELPRSLVEVVTSWNLPMHTWLRKYVFNQVKHFGYFFAILITYAASSLLHGLNFQLSAVLLSLGFYSYVEYALRRKLANLFNSCIMAKRCKQSDCPNHQNKYWKSYVLSANVFFGCLAIFHLAYLGLMFDSSDPEQAESHALAAAVDLRTNLTIEISEKPNFQAVFLNRDWLIDLQLSDLVSFSHRLHLPNTPQEPSDDDFTILCQLLNISRSDTWKALDLAKISAVWLFLCICRYRMNSGLSLAFTTELPIGAGLGSSASFGSCLSYAFLLHSKSGQEPFNPENINLSLVNEWAFISEKLLHGNPSGVDNATTVYGGAMLFKSGHFTRVRMPTFRIVLIDTKVNRSTREIVEGVRERYETNKSKYEKEMHVFDQITLKAKNIFEDNMSYDKFKEFEQCIIENQCALDRIGVGHEKITKVLKAAGMFKITGKLTGAGGGGCLFVLIPEKFPEKELKELSSQIEQMDCRVYITKIGVQGINCSVCL